MAAAVAVAFVAVAPAAVVAQVPNAAPEDSDHLDHTVDHEYNVEFEDNGPLGLELDERLRVTAFRRGKGGVMGAAEATGWISVGDRLVSVNERPLEGVALRDAVMHIHRASTPRILRFHTRAHTDRIVQMQREMAARVSRQSALGSLLFSHQDMPQGNFSFVQALFGGPPSCTPLPVVEAVPIHGCSELKNPEDELAGAIVVVERGVCAFSDKAVNVQMFGGSGVLVLNKNGPAFRMPAAEYERGEVQIFAAMVGSDVAEQVRHVLEHGLKPIQAQLQHDDHWCVEHRNITEAHPKSVTEDNVTVAYVDREFMSGEVLVSGLDNYDIYYDDEQLDRFEYLKASFGNEPAATVAMEVDSKAAFRASNYKIPDDHPVNTTVRESGLNATMLFDSRTTSGAVRLVEGQPQTGCQPFTNAPGELEGAAILLRRGECAFEVKQQRAADAGAIAIIVTNDRQGLLPMAASSPAAVVDEVAAVMVTSRSGSSLRQMVRDASNYGMPLWVRFAGDDRFVQGWKTIQDLIDKPSAWPRKARKRRKLYFRLSREHHPDKPGGSDERFEALNFAYRLGNHHYNPGSTTIDDLL